MKITEIKQDLFTMPSDYALVHCIGADFKLGAGIAKKLMNYLTYIKKISVGITKEFNEKRCLL